MCSALKKAFDARKITLASTRKNKIINYSTIRRHYKGLRKISVTDVLRYEKIFGIPRYELRPDLWSQKDGGEKGEEQ